MVFSFLKNLFLKKTSSRYVSLAFLSICYNKKVIAVGPGKYTTNGNLIPCSVKVGDKYFSTLQLLYILRIGFSFLVLVVIVLRLTTRTLLFSTTAISLVFSNKLMILYSLWLFCLFSFIFFFQKILLQKFQRFCSCI